MPDFSKLTDRQREIYEFIRKKIESRGYGPTVREIGENFGIKSPNGVMCHLKALEKKGLASETAIVVTADHGHTGRGGHGGVEPEVLAVPLVMAGAGVRAGASSFDAVVSFYAFNHVPRELLAPLLGRIHDWLAPSGRLMAAFGTTDLEGWTGEFLGATTFFSSFPPAINSQLVVDAGFVVERDEVIAITEPEGPAPFQWILARR